ncbi:MAG: hypothetical protein Q7V57_19585 [Actinomycetota bacterium]|nr:hypothetical protein [Actinomycetota bacterium]
MPDTDVTDTDVTDTTDTPTRSARKRQPLGLALCVQLLLVFYQIRPLLWSAYNSDDVLTSQWPMWRAYRGQSLWSDFIATNSDFMRNKGRFFPGTVAEIMVVFEVFRSRQSYKVLQIVFVMLAWLAFVWFVQVCTRSIHYAVLAGWLALLTVHMRWFHDPLLGFAVQQPTLVICWFATLILATLAARADSRRRHLVLLVAATVMWVATMLMYETAYSLVLAPLCILFSISDRSRRRRALATIIVPTVLLLTWLVYLRANAAHPEPNLQLGFHTWQVIPTFVHQLTGTLPFSYELLAQDGTMPRMTSGWGVNGGWDVLALLATVAMLVVCVRWLRPKPLDKDTSRVLLVAGGLMLLGPTTIISFTLRWQQGEVDWGLPYISVFISSLGLMLLVLVAISSLVRRFGSLASRPQWARRVMLTALVPVSLGVLAAPILIYDTNYWTVEQVAWLRTDREAFAQLVRDGGFDEVPAGSTVITDNASEWFWENGAFVQYYGGPQQLTLVLPTDPAAAACGVSTTCYRLVTTVHDDGSTTHRIDVMQPAG